MFGADGEETLEPAMRAQTVGQEEDQEEGEGNGDQGSSSLILQK
jgi:hypothetical protein